MARGVEPLIIEKVIGEVVDNFNPSVKLKVIYNSSKEVYNGHELMPAVIMSKPRVEIGGEDMRNAYTLVSFTINPSFLLCLLIDQCMSLCLHVKENLCNMIT